MMHTSVHGAGINQVSHTHLLYVPQPLEPRVGNYMHYLRLRKAQESIDRVVNNLDFQRLPDYYSSFSSLPVLSCGSLPFPPPQSSAGGFVASLLMSPSS